MGNDFRAAQADYVTSEGSFNTVFQLVKFGIYHIIYLRGLLQENDFTKTEIEDAPGMEIQMLNASSSFARSSNFMIALEEGVKDALQKKYIATLKFQIRDNADSTDLLEEYCFTFTYNHKGKVSLQLRSGSSTFKIESKASIRFQVKRLLRNLVVLCNCLYPLSTKPELSLEMSYNKSSPAGYRAPHFAPFETPYTFPQTPLTMEVAEVKTGHHTVSLRLETLRADAEDLLKTQTSFDSSSFKDSE